MVTTLTSQRVVNNANQDSMPRDLKPTVGVDGAQTVKCTPMISEHVVHAELVMNVNSLVIRELKQNVCKILTPWREVRLVFNAPEVSQLRRDRHRVQNVLPGQVFHLQLEIVRNVCLVGIHGHQEYAHCAPKER